MQPSHGRPVAHIVPLERSFNNEDLPLEPFHDCVVDTLPIDRGKLAVQDFVKVIRSDAVGNLLEPGVHCRLILFERLPDGLGLPDKDPSIPVEVSRRHKLSRRLQIRFFAKPCDGVSGRRLAHGRARVIPFDVTVDLRRIVGSNAKRHDSIRVLLDQIDGVLERRLKRRIR